MEKCLRKTAIHPGILGGRALWADQGAYGADSGHPRMNTIASRD